jgi:hypothetical protein
LREEQAFPLPNRIAIAKDDEQVPRVWPTSLLHIARNAALEASACAGPARSISSTSADAP